MAKTNKSKYKKIKKELNKFSKTAKIICCFLFIFGIFGGVFTTYFLTKNDIFKIVGNTKITLNVGEAYVEQGAKIIAFGKDISDQVVIQGEVNTAVADSYVLKYTVDNFRFKNYTLYKLVIVQEVDNG